jgi:hypothetical protein
MIRAPLVALTLAIATPALAQELDPTTLVKAPGRLSVSEELRVGYTVTQTARMAGMEQVNFYAVVGEDEETFQIEYVGPGFGALAATLPQLKGALMGLVVRKADGVVLEAFLGKPGEEPRPIEVLESAPRAETPEGEEAEVEIALGRFPCMKIQVGETTNYVGKDGELEGVLLKVEGATTYELSALPEAGETSLGDEVLTTRTLTYSNGQTFVVTDDPVVKAFFPSGIGGMLEMRTPDLTVKVTKRGSDATPRLSW